MPQRLDAGHHFIKEIGMSRQFPSVIWWMNRINTLVDVMWFYLVQVLPTIILVLVGPFFLSLWYCHKKYTFLSSVTDLEAQAKLKVWLLELVVNRWCEAAYRLSLVEEEDFSSEFFPAFCSCASDSFGEREKKAISIDSGQSSQAFSCRRESKLRR